DRERSVFVGRSGSDGVYTCPSCVFYLAIVVGPFVSVPRRRRCTVRPHTSIAIHFGPRPHHHIGLQSVLSTIF
ncbi:Uncharacterized protein FWK35_00004581, partial [Aphis craccivora]